MRNGLSSNIDDLFPLECRFVVAYNGDMASNAIDLERLYYKQRGLCYWCRGPMILDGGNDARNATREHLIPRSHGGTNWMKVRGRKVCNVVAACKKCNNGRGNMDAHTFKSTMRPHVK